MQAISQGLSTKLAIVAAAVVSTLVVVGLSVGAAKPTQSINGYSKDQCKNGGWQNMQDANGNSFKNQGDCVSYFATGGSNPGNG